MKVAIIKLGAKGDVIRTIPIVRTIKEKFPDSEISWITKENIKELLQGIPYVNKVPSIPYETKEQFDILYNFDIDDEATALAKEINAKEKFGFQNQDNFVTTFNLGAEYYLNTLFDDEIKKTNEKTYQEMMHMAAELDYKKQHAGIQLREQDLQYAEQFVQQNKIEKEKLVGIHLGASPRWPSKTWHKSCLKEFIKKAKEKNYQILLFGGPDEIEEHTALVKELNESNIKIFKNDPHNTDGQFVSLVNSCKSMICSDSFALHIAIALKKPTIGLFFCTSPNEVEPYGYLRKIISPLFYEIFPEKQDQYNEELMKGITPDEVIATLEEINATS